MTTFRSSTRLTHERLRTIISQNPGIHVRRLTVIMGLSWNTVVHHLRTMEREGHLSSRKVQGRVCWFDRDAGAVQGKEGLALLRDRRNASVAQAILERPGLSQVQLSERLGLATSIVHRRIVHLESSGLLERRSAARSKLVYPSDHLVGAALHAGCLPESMRAHIVPADREEIAAQGTTFLQHLAEEENVGSMAWLEREDPHGQANGPARPAAPSRAGVLPGLDQDEGHATETVTN